MVLLGIDHVGGDRLLPLQIGADVPRVGIIGQTRHIIGVLFHPAVPGTECLPQCRDILPRLQVPGAGVVIFATLRRIAGAAHAHLRTVQTLQGTYFVGQRGYVDVGIGVGGLAIVPCGQRDAAVGPTGEMGSREFFVHPGVGIVDAHDEILLTRVLNRVLPGRDHRETTHLFLGQTVGIFRRPAQILEIAQRFIEQLTDRIIGFVAKFAEMVDVVDYSAAIARAATAHAATTPTGAAQIADEQPVTAELLVGIVHHVAGPVRHLRPHIFHVDSQYSAVPLLRVVQCVTGQRKAHLLRILLNQPFRLVIDGAVTLGIGHTVRLRLAFHADLDLRVIERELVSVRPFETDFERISGLIGIIDDDHFVHRPGGHRGGSNIVGRADPLGVKPPACLGRLANDGPGLRIHHPVAAGHGPDIHVNGRGGRPVEKIAAELAAAFMVAIGESLGDELAVLVGIATLGIEISQIFPVREIAHPEAPLSSGALIACPVWLALRLIVVGGTTHRSFHRHVQQDIGVDTPGDEQGNVGDGCRGGRRNHQNRGKRHHNHVHHPVFPVLEHTVHPHHSALVDALKPNR